MTRERESGSEERRTDVSDPRPDHRERERAAILELAGVPERFRDRTFGSFHQRSGTTAALRAARATGESGRGLVLLGPPGTGKTHLAAAILAERVDRYLGAYPEPVAIDDGGMTVRPPFGSRFVGVPRLLEDLRRRIGDPSLRDPLTALESAPLLVLDDLGREKTSDWTADRLYVLVDARYGARRPTVVTSNFSLDELADRGYDALVSRVCEDADLVGLSASDYRLVAGRADRER